MISNSQCKICRRQGVKLFLKGERCLSQKCQMVKRPDSPGPKRKKGGRKTISEYGKELIEKQRLKNWYNSREREFKNYVMEVLKKRSKGQDPTSLLIKNLESRLDNVIFRLGFAESRKKARQLVSHGYFFINGKLVNIPSYRTRINQAVAVNPAKVGKIPIQNIKDSLKKYKTPGWLALNAEKLEGKIIGEPTLQETNPPAEISAVFEFYSR